MEVILGSLADGPHVSKGTPWKSLGQSSQFVEDGILLKRVFSLCVTQNINKKAWKSVRKIRNYRSFCFFQYYTSQYITTYLHKMWPQSGPRHIISWDEGERCNEITNAGNWQIQGVYTHITTINTYSHIQVPCYLKFLYVFIL